MDIKHYMKHSLKHDCYRCQSSPARFYCNECHNGFFCEICDIHVHSLSSKKRHTRRSLPERIRETDYATCSLSSFRPSSPLNRSLGVNQPITYQRSSSTIDVTNSINVKKRQMHCCCNELRKINEEEKEELLSTITILKQKLSNSASTLNEKTECLYSQIDDLKQRYIKEMHQSNQRQTDIFDNILLEKEDRINFLYDKVYQLEEINSKQKNKIEEYEELLNSSQSNFRDKIALANCHLDELMNENAMIKEYYEKKIGDITNISAEERNKIENKYEKSIETMKVGYETSKAKHLEIIQQKEREIRELMEKYQNEKIEMTGAIDKLKKANDKQLREKVDLIKTNTGLKKTIDEANESIYNLKTDLKEHLKEKRELNEQLDKIKCDNENLVSKSEKLNHMLFGRFKRKKINVEQ